MLREIRSRDILHPKKGGVTMKSAFSLQQTLTARLEALAKLRREPQQEVIAEAIELGVSRLYTESILARYLKRRLSRRRAIRAVGIDAVKIAEAQNAAVRKDLAWGLGG
jgi:predicted DNA-binding protein